MAVDVNDRFSVRDFSPMRGFGHILSIALESEFLTQPDVTEIDRAEQTNAEPGTP